jgi:hypothetical protein
VNVVGSFDLNDIGFDSLKRLCHKRKYSEFDNAYFVTGYTCGKTAKENSQYCYEVISTGTAYQKLL